MVNYGPHNNPDCTCQGPPHPLCHSCTYLVPITVLYNLKPFPAPPPRTLDQGDEDDDGDIFEVTPIYASDPIQDEADSDETHSSMQSGDGPEANTDAPTELGSNAAKATLSSASHTDDGISNALVDYQAYLEYHLGIFTDLGFHYEEPSSEDEEDISEFDGLTTEQLFELCRDILQELEDIEDEILGNSGAPQAE